MKLPIELYRDIFQLLVSTPNEFIALSTVSRTFHSEVEPVLHHTIDLTGKDFHQIHLWATKVNQLPRIAKMIYVLKLSEKVDIPPAEEQVDFFLLLAGALKYIFRLKSLHFVPPPPGLESSGVSIIQPWMIKGCRFRLHLFSGRPKSFKDKELWWFFYEQPDIREWRSGSHPFSLQTQGFLPEWLLPNLIAVNINPQSLEEGTSMLKGIADRPIERLTIRCNIPGRYHMPFRPADLIKDSIAFEASLTHLTCEGWEGSCIRPVSVIVDIFRQLPRLRYFAWTNRRPPTFALNSSKKLLDSLAVLANLETLVLDSPYAVSSGQHHQNRDLVDYYMSLCPSLQKVNFRRSCPGAGASPDIYHRLSYLRGTHGTVESAPVEYEADDEL